jgi:hypothetical protein
MYRVLVHDMVVNCAIYIVDIALSAVGFCVGQATLQNMYAFTTASSESDKVGALAVLSHYFKLRIKQ